MKHVLALQQYTTANSIKTYINTLVSLSEFCLLYVTYCKLFSEQDTSTETDPMSKIIVMKEIVSEMKKGDLDFLIGITHVVDNSLAGVLDLQYVAIKHLKKLKNKNKKKWFRIRNKRIQENLETLFLNRSWFEYITFLACSALINFYLGFSNDANSHIVAFESLLLLILMIIGPSKSELNPPNEPKFN